MTGNEFARELLEKELHRLHPTVVRFDEKYVRKNNKVLFIEHRRYYNNNNKNVNKSYIVGRKVEFMGTLIGIILLICIFKTPSIIRNYTFNHRRSPEGCTTDHGAMNRDFASGMSVADVQNKFNRGGYDVKQ